MTATGSIRTRAPMTVNRRAAATASRAVIERQERTALKPAMTATKTLEMAAIGSVAERSAVTGGSTKEKPVMMATAETDAPAVVIAAAPGDGIRRQDVEPGQEGYEACDDGNADPTDVLERLRRRALRRRAGTIRGGSL